MTRPALNSLLLSSTNHERLADWYVKALEPQRVEQMDHYRILTFGDVMLVIDTRTDIGDRNPEPGRIILNFDVDDARGIVDRMNGLGVEWVAPLEDREGDLVATAIDPDGNYIQVWQMSEASRRMMESGGFGTAETDAAGAGAQMEA